MRPGPRARSENDTGEKLNAIADAIPHEFVEFVELVEHQIIRHIEARLRRMEM